MSIQVTCDGCGTQMKVGDQFAGKKGKCKKCGAVMRVPELAPEPPSVAAEPDMYDFAEPAPVQPTRTASAGTATLPPIPAPAASPAPPASLQYANLAASRGVVLGTSNASSRTSSDQPMIMKVLKFAGGALLLLLGLALAGGSIYAMVGDDGTRVRRPTKGLFGGITLMVLGGGLIRSAMVGGD